MAAVLPISSAFRLSHKLPVCSASTRGVRMCAVELEPSLLVKRKAEEMSEVLRGTSLFLVGMNGRMKTCTGKILADALRYYYFDSDNLVVQATGGISGAQALFQKDEQEFRDSETEVLKQLSSMGRLVICAGDGAVRSSTNLAYLRHGISIWIDVPVDILAEEMHTNCDEYPFFKATTPPRDSYLEMLDVLAKRYTEAQEGYATADATISLQGVASGLDYRLENVTPEDMAVEALNRIEKLIRVKKMMEDAARPF